MRLSFLLASAASVALITGCTTTQTSSEPLAPAVADTPPPLAEAKVDTVKLVPPVAKR
jgi:hypothetical protein